jgi:O-antigen ligase
VKGAHSVVAERSTAPDTLRARKLAPLVVAAAVAGGLGAAKLAAMRQPMLIILFVLVLVPLALWKWPQAGVLALLAGTVTIEQFRYTVGPRAGVFTDKIPLFQSLSKGSGVTPAEMLLVLMTLIWLMKGAIDRSWGAPRSPLARSILLLLGIVVVGFAVGVAHGGKIKVAGWEVRPWFYLGFAYLFTASLLRTRNVLRTILWTLVLGSGFKAIQGVMMFLSIRHMPGRPENILAHEESFFFGVFIILTLGLWLFQVKGRLRVVATCLLPFVLIADMANARRNAWAIIGTTLIAFGIAAYSALPERRRGLRRIAAVVMVVSAVYFPLFWNKTGTLAQAARAVHSQIAPDARDKQSNQYRIAENANLALNIRQSASLGRGFGLPIHYAIAIVDISNVDAAIAFLPHNGILWVWMRMGILGEVLFWAMVAAAIIRSCQLVKTGDRELALFGTVAVCAVVAYVVQGYNDLGLFWFRIAICLGVLLGGVEVALRLVSGHDGPHGPDEELLALLDEAEPAPAGMR